MKDITCIEIGKTGYFLIPAQYFAIQYNDDGIEGTLLLHNDVAQHVWNTIDTNLDKIETAQGKFVMRKGANIMKVAKMVLPRQLHCLNDTVFDIADSKDEPILVLKYIMWQKDGKAYATIKEFFLSTKVFTNQWEFELIAWKTKQEKNVVTVGFLEKK